MEEPINAVVCDKCGGVFKSPAGLMSHKRSAHAEDVAPVVVETEKKVEVKQSANVEYDKIEQLRKFVAVSLNDPELKKMFDLICSKPWIRTYIQREAGEPKGAVQTIGINGVRFDIPKNAYVDLPQPLVAMLNDTTGVSDEYVKQYQVTEENKLGKQL